MVRPTAIILAVILLTGCNNANVLPPVVETQYVNVPVFQCPANYTDIESPNRPVLAIHLLTDEQLKNPGSVARAYRVSVEQLLQYAHEMETTTDSFQSICDVVD